MLGQATKRNRGNEIYKARETREPRTRTSPKYMCDLCDKKTPFEYIHRTRGAVYLCPECHKIISAMPRDEVKASVMRFLMRNVL
jgi:uncharacterized protein YlaI